MQLPQRLHLRLPWIQAFEVIMQVVKFNFEPHYTKWEILTLISQYTQGLNQSVQIWIWISQVEFTNLETLAYFVIYLDKKSTAVTTHWLCIPCFQPQFHGYLCHASTHNDQRQWKIMNSGLCFRCGMQGYIPCDFLEKPKTKGKGKPTNKPCIEAHWVKFTHWDVKWVLCQIRGIGISTKYQ